MKDGGPAFPVSNDANEAGMTLRDYFAAAALTGLLAGKSAGTLGSNDRGWPVCAEKDAYLIADAMLAEREKQ